MYPNYVGLYGKLEQAASKIFSYAPMCVHELRYAPLCRLCSHASLTPLLLASLDATNISGALCVCNIKRVSPVGAPSVIVHA